MTVTALEQKQKNRYRVYLDGEFAFVLYKGELRSFEIREGEELKETFYHRILEEVLPKRAKLRAMNLLQKKSFAVEELRRKLRDGEYPESVIEQALDYVASYGYTDDVRYAADYIRYHGQDRSRRRMEQDLARKGISRDSFAKAWAECEELGIAGDEQEQIRKLLQRKHYDPDHATREETAKLGAFLMRKGYSFDAVQRELHNLYEN